MAAELDRLGELIGLIAPERGDKEEDDTGGGKDRQDLAVARAREVDLENERRRDTHRPALRAPLQQNTDADEHEAEEEEPGRRDVGKNAHVRIAMARHEVNRNEEEKGEDRGGREDDTGPTDPVAQVMLERLARNGAVRHQSKIKIGKGRAR